MAEYRRITGASTDDVAQDPVFAPFAGTEGYTPVAYGTDNPNHEKRTFELSLV